MTMVTASIISGWHTNARTKLYGTRTALQRVKTTIRYAVIQPYGTGMETH